MRKENELRRGRWPTEVPGTLTSRNDQFNSCNKENVFSREQLFHKAMSPQNQRGRVVSRAVGEPTSLTERLRELTNRRDMLLREKLSYCGLFTELRKEKERL